MEESTEPPQALSEQPQQSAGVVDATASTNAPESLETVATTKLQVDDDDDPPKVIDLQDPEASGKSTLELAKNWSSTKKYRCLALIGSE